MTKDKKQEDKNGIGYEWEYANKVDTRSTWEKIKSGIYDPSTHAVLGRTLQSWGKYSEILKISFINFIELLQAYLYFFG